MTFFMGYFLIIISLFSFFYSNSQGIADRLEADYSIKEIFENGEQSLIVGKVYFDRSSKTLTHSQSFPTQNLFVFRDSTVLLVHEDTIIRGNSSVLSINFSIYNLILNNNISDFGLQKMGFEILDVFEQEDKVISKWKYPQQSGYIAITQSDGWVDGAIFYGPNEKPIVKQYFRDYEKEGRIFFPSKIFEITYTKEGERKKITTHRNIKIDDFSDEEDLYSLFDTSINKLIFSGKN